MGNLGILDAQPAAQVVQSEGKAYATERQSRRTGTLLPRDPRSGVVREATLADGLYVQSVSTTAPCVLGQIDMATHRAIRLAARPFC